MNPLILIFIVLGIGMMVYALFGVWSVNFLKRGVKSQKRQVAELQENDYMQSKIQQQQIRIGELEEASKKLQEIYDQEKIELQELKLKQEEHLDEIKRREEWVAKAEKELAKIKAENLELKDRFMNQEKELQEEFAKNVKFSQEKDELKTILVQKEENIKLQAEAAQIQYHQLQNQLQARAEHLALIAEFKRKEKINQWVTKEEFDKLNEEHTQIEKELEASQERIKRFSQEIADLHLELKKSQTVDIVLPPGKDNPQTEGEK